MRGLEHMLGPRARQRQPQVLSGAPAAGRVAAVGAHKAGAWRRHDGAGLLHDGGGLRGLALRDHNDVGIGLRVAAAGQQAGRRERQRRDRGSASS
jgi:hypothetical protein